MLFKIKISNLTDILEQVTSESESIDILSGSVIEQSKESKVQDEAEPKLPCNICGKDKSQLIQPSIN